MEKVILKAEVREGTGKRVAKDLRNKKIIPAVVYRGGKPGTNLQVSEENLLKALHTKAGENVLITLEISGDQKTVKDKTVLIKEIQHDTVKDNILHVDFSEISLSETIKVDVPINFKGEPVGVKQDGGVIDFVIRELHVECLPANIPENIPVDISALKINDSLMIKDVVVPADVKVLNEPDLIVAVVKPPHVEKPKEEVVEAAAEEPELIRKEKLAEEEETEEDASKKDASKKDASKKEAPKKEAPKKEEK